MECAGRRYPEQTAVLTQGPLVEFLLFAAADVENPERVRRGKKEKNPQNVFQRRLMDLSETRTRSHALT